MATSDDQLWPRVSSVANNLYVEDEPPGRGLPSIELEDMSAANQKCFWNALARIDGYKGKDDTFDSVFDSKVNALGTGDKATAEKKLKNSKDLRGSQLNAWAGDAELTVYQENLMPTKRCHIFVVSVHPGITAQYYKPSPRAKGPDQYAYMVHVGTNHFQLAKIHDTGEYVFPVSALDRVMWEIKRRFPRTRASFSVPDQYAIEDEGRSLFAVLRVVSATAYANSSVCRSFWNGVISTRFRNGWDPVNITNAETKEGLSLALWFPLKEERQEGDVSIYYPRSLAMAATDAFIAAYNADKGTTTGKYVPRVFKSAIEVLRLPEIAIIIANRIPATAITLKNMVAGISDFPIGLVKNPVSAPPRS